MRLTLLKSVVALAVVASSAAYADDDGGNGQVIQRRPQPQYQQQPQYEQPYDQGQYDQGQYDQSYDQPYEQQAPVQNNIIIQNREYQVQDNTFFVPGHGGIPSNFVCEACRVNWTPGYAEVIAMGPYGAYRLWGGFPGCNNVNLISVVNSIKRNSGMCPNLPFLPVQPCVYGGPVVRPMPLPQPLPGRGYYPPGRGPGPRPFPRPTPYIR